MEAWEAGLIFWVANLIFMLTLGISSRCYYDRNRDGIISSDEVPVLSLARYTEPVDGASLMEFVTFPGISVILCSFAFAACYGSLSVMACNWLLVDNADDSWGWALNIQLCFLTFVFMCTFASNYIHVMTNHIIHFVYYGSGTLGVALYWRNPDWYVVFPTVLGFLINHAIFRYVSFPNYPELKQLIPLYTRGSSGEIILISRPDGSVSPEKDIGLSDAFTLQVPLPAFEALNILITSHSTLGGILGASTGGILRAAGMRETGDADTDQSGAIVLIGAGVALLVSTVWVLLPLETLRYTFSPLSRFYPRVCATLAAGVGGAIGAAAHSEVTWTQASAAILAAHVATHAYAALLVALSMNSSIRHFGCLKAMLNCLPDRVSAILYSKTSSAPAAPRDPGAPALE